MTSHTNTQFKQKTCPKCKNNHDNEGVLCSFCVQRAEQAMARAQVQPKDFFVKCLIEREGDTVLTLGNLRYIFTRNQLGDPVCEIVNLGHYNQIIKSGFYEPYVPKEVEEPVTIQAEPFTFTDEEAAMIDRMLEAGEKHTIIAAKISAEFGRDISRQRITRYHQM